MPRMADCEGTGDGNGLIPFIIKDHVNAQGEPLSSIKTLAKAAPDITEPDTSIDAELVPLPVSKQSQPPKVPPKLDVSHGDTHGESSLSKMLSTETDLEFLQQLLDDIYSLDTERVSMSPLTKAAPTGDPMLEALTAAPSCHRRENAELLAPIFDDIS